ncbi:hypothetical protein VTN77DRAFT_8596 [Rasamsonia byssochlamydoides]|uniref:uncharacterized protein n=1 Tax=Rasamsonia byssochlamydoides TaxID=89139 RepID=UPI003744A171
MRLSFPRLPLRLRFFPQYRLVRDQETEEEESQESPNEKPCAGRPALIYSPYWLWLNIALFSLSIVFFVLSFGVHRRNYLVKQVSMPSPVLDKIEVKIRPKRMDASWSNQAWKILGDTRPIPLTRTQVLAIGKDPQQAVRLPESWGLGPDMYAGRVDVFRHVHCLDSLRREAYFDYYYSRKYPGGFNDTTPMHRVHLSHCIYFLLQNIMCNANTDVYTHFWTDTLDHPFPDFTIHHQCRDFEAVLKWQQRHALDEAAFVDLRRPEDYGPPHVMSYRFKEIHDYFRDHEDHGKDADGEVAYQSRYSGGEIYVPKIFSLKSSPLLEESQNIPNEGFVTITASETTTAHQFGVSMFHQLHCLELLRNQIRNESETEQHHHAFESQSHYQDQHLEHCLDYLAQSIVCAADDTLEPPEIYPLPDGQDLDVINGDGVVHHCRDASVVREILLRSQEEALQAPMIVVGGKVREGETVRSLLPLITT